MAKDDGPINVITGVRGVGEEQRREVPERRKVKRHIKPGNDSVTISSRARRLADIEGFLDEGPDKEKPVDDKDGR